jgi:hypothetical protein
MFQICQKLLRGFCMFCPAPREGAAANSSAKVQSCEQENEA